MVASKLVLSLLVAALLLHVAATLKISAFNIRVFGDSKMSNQTIADIIVSVSAGEEKQSWPLSSLWDAASLGQSDTRFLQASVHPCVHLVPLGRTSYKEQYVFIFRSDMVSVLGSYYYDDGCEPCGTDTFSREPFIVKFSSPTTQVEEFVMVPLHATPSSAADEIDALYDVYTDVINKWATNNILLLGDFNADCSYVTSAQWPSIRLRSLDACEWLIPDSADTTVTDTTDCAYDRWLPLCFPPCTQALAVSDHFPVEVTLKAPRACIPRGSPRTTSTSRAAHRLCKEPLFGVLGEWDALCFH
uniref:Deoxyribonuclease n=1 Tax=Buteo japonicus TaxID=224669 RepID=A0A8C0BF94_9AVES